MMDDQEMAPCSWCDQRYLFKVVKLFRPLSTEKIDENPIVYATYFLLRVRKSIGMHTRRNISDGQ